MFPLLFKKYLHNNFCLLLEFHDNVKLTTARNQYKNINFPILVSLLFFIFPNSVVRTVPERCWTAVFEISGTKWHWSIKDVRTHITSLYRGTKFGSKSWYIKQVKSPNGNILYPPRTPSFSVSIEPVKLKDRKRAQHFLKCFYITLKESSFLKCFLVPQKLT